MLEFWQDWQSFIFLGGLFAAVISFANPFLIALALVMAVSLSPELPLGLPVRLGDFVLLWGVIVFLLRFNSRQAYPWPKIINQRFWLQLLAVEFIATLIGALQNTTQLDFSVYSGIVFFLKSVETFLLYVIVVLLLNTPTKIRQYSWALLIGGALLGGYGLNNMFSGNSPIEGVVVDIEGGATYSLIALALIPPLALGLSVWFTHTNLHRWLAIGLLLPIGYAFLFTLSRQAYIGVAVMIWLFIWLRNRSLLYWAIPAVGLVFWLYPATVPQAVAERVTSIVDPFTGETLNQSFIYRGEYGIYTTRLNAWQRRLPEMLTTNPLTGLGLAALPPGWLDSQYLVILYYTGFLGLFVFLRLLQAFGRQSWWLYQTASEPLGQALGLASLGAIVGFVVASFGGSPFVAIRAREMFWLLMAAMAAYSIQSGIGSYDEKPIDYS